VKITVTVPALDGPAYLRQVADQLEAGMKSGHWDARTHWESARDSYVPERR